MVILNGYLLYVETGHILVIPISSIILLLSSYDVCTSKVVNPRVNCEVLVDGKTMTETCVIIDNYLHQFWCRW
jgi:hypothetical protein